MGYSDAWDANGAVSLFGLGGFVLLFAAVGWILVGRAISRRRASPDHSTIDRGVYSSLQFAAYATGAGMLIALAGWMLHV